MSRHNLLQRIFYGEYIKPQSVNAVVSLILISALAIKLIYIFKGLSDDFIEQINGFGFTEYLINFEGGFVRRGLIGEILFYICRGFALNPFYLISLICIISYIVTLLFFWQKFREHNYCWWLLLSSLFCASTIAFIRKDYLLYCVFILTVIVLKKNSGNNIKYIVVTFLSIIGLFMHEAYVFWGIPFILVFLYIGNRNKWYYGLSLVLIFSTAALLFINKGDNLIAEHIRTSWNEEVFKNTVLLDINDNSIGALGWGAIDTFLYHFKTNFALSSFGVFGFIIRIMEYILVYYLMTNFLFIVTNNKRLSYSIEQRQLALSALFVFVSVCLSPMFIFLSCDWGRLYQYIIISSFTVFLLFPSQLVLDICPKVYLKLLGVFNKTLSKILVPTKPLLIILLLFINISGCYFNIDYDLLGSPIGTLFAYIGYILHYIFHSIG